LVDLLEQLGPREILQSQVRTLKKRRKRVGNTDTFHGIVARILELCDAKVVDFDDLACAWERGQTERPWGPVG
jgi:hypothetical protein